MPTETVVEAGNSLGDRVRHVEDAWIHAQGGEYQGYVLDVFEDSLIVKTGTYDQPYDQRKCYRVPYTVNPDDTLAFADMSQWTEVTLDYVPVASGEPEEVTESWQGFMQESDTGTREAVILVEGMSANRKLYTRQALDSGVAVFEGARMYVDHPSTSEAADRPERSVRDLVGVVENVRVGKTRDGRNALLGTPRLSSNAGWLQTLVNEGIAGALSIRARGRATPGENGSLIVESFVDNPTTSVDFVTVAGAGGGYELRESAPWGGLTPDALRQHRPDLVEELQEREPTTLLVDIQESEDIMTDERVTTLTAQLEEANRTIAELRTAQRTQEANQTLTEAIGDGLPEQTVTRLKLMAQPAIQKFAQDAEQTREQLAESLSALVQSERDYIASFGGGGIVIPTHEAAPADGEIDLAEAFAALLHDKEAGQVAARGRGVNHG